MPISTPVLEICRIVFAVLLIVANIAVWLGVYLENEHFPQHKKDAGWALLVRALAAEAVLAMFLFWVDTTISNRQKAAIALLEAQIAPRNLTRVQIDQLILRLAPFRGRTIALQSYFGDTEGHRLLLVLGQALGAAGLKIDFGYWSPDTSPDMKFLLGTEVDAPADHADLAQALQEGLQETPIGMRPNWYPTSWTKEVTVHIGVKPFDIPLIQRETASAPLAIDAYEKTERTKDKLSPEWWLVYVTAGLSAITLALAVFTAFLWTSTKRLVITTDRTTRTHERAYIFASLSLTGHSAAVLSCSNEGRTPGLTVSVEWGTCEPQALPTGASVKDILDNGLVPTANLRIVPVAEVLASEARQVNLWSVAPELTELFGKIFFGRIQYQDVFREAHYSTFKFRVEPVDGAPFGFRLVPLQGCYLDWA